MPKRLRGFQKGHPSYLTEDSKRKIGISLKRYYKTHKINFSDEHRKKLSETAKRKGFGKWNKGRRHSLRTRILISRNYPKIEGNKHYNWKGGRYKNTQGYILVYKPNHRFCNNDGYIREHRFIMEKYLGRYLTMNEVAHHVNGIKHDNRLENLQLLTKHEHNKLPKKRRR